MRISANDIKAGNILDYEGELWMVAKTPEHTKPGKGGAYVQVEMKNLRTGGITLGRRLVRILYQQHRLKN